MAYTELAFERLHLALETTRGTAIGSPTHLLNLPGKLTPHQTMYRPAESRGTLVRNYRNKVVRKWAEWEAEGAADPNILPVLFNLAVKPVTSPTTPGTLSKLWTFVRSVAADDIKTATLWAGDPNVQSWRAVFAVIDEISIVNDASSEETAVVSVKGLANFAEKITAPTSPASIAGDVFPGQQMQVWIDTSSAIGTTAVTGRVIAVEHTIPVGVEYKYLAAGPAGGLGYAAIGRVPTAAKTKLVLELPDMVQYDLWAAATSLKARVRHNGAFIETVATVDYYNYFEMDVYGPFDLLDWSEKGGNRTVELTIESQYDTTLGADFRVAVQNQRGTL